MTMAAIHSAASIVIDLSQSSGEASRDVLSPPPMVYSYLVFAFVSRAFPIAIFH